VNLTRKRATLPHQIREMPMRTLVAFLVSSLLLVTTAWADIGPKPDFGRPSNPPIKVCSVFVANAWRAAILVPFSWGFSNCRDYARSVEATSFQAGCVLVDAPRTPGPKFYWARANTMTAPALDCGWRTGGSLEWTASAKVCSVLTPNAWRSLTMVNESWTAEDCRAMAREARASHVQLGCIVPGGGIRFTWARRNLRAEGPLPPAGVAGLYVPESDCGWQSPAEDARGFPGKLCTALVRGGWRSMTWVPPAWTPADCQAFSASIGATFYQLGCIYQTPPAGSAHRYVWGPASVIGRNQVDAPILSSCGWRFT
jgi:hypothetical protein